MPPPADVGGAVGAGGAAGATAGAAGSAGADEGGAAGMGGMGGEPQVPIHSGCDEGDLSEFYVLADNGDLYRFDPETVTLSTAVALSAPGPNSLALNPDGTLYLATYSGMLATVDPETGACTATAFDPAPWGIETFFAVGQGNAPADGGAGSLYLARDPGDSSTELYSLDLSSFVSTLLTTFSVRSMEVTAGDNGRLFGQRFASSQAQLVEYDTSSYAVIDTMVLGSSDVWWGYDVVWVPGYLYAFGGAGPDDANVYRASTSSPLSTQTPEMLGTIPIDVIGAGARVCP